MEKRKFIISGIFLCLMLFSCYEEIEIPAPRGGPTVTEGFEIADARHYFEENAIDLAPLSFSEEVATKTYSRQMPELSPDWNKAMLSGHRGVSLVEVPLRSNSVSVYTETMYKDGKKALQKRYISNRRLVIARRSTGETDMFVVTIVPLPTAKGNAEKSMKSFRYLGGGDFTGRVFCSTLDGRFVKAFGYTRGQLNGTLLVMKRSDLEKHADGEWKQHYSSITFQERIRTRSGTYLFDEGGGGGNPDLCPHGYADGSCPQCLEEVIVVACRYCNTINGCVCDICMDCGNREPECMCPRCWVCDEKIWDCTCYEYPDPDSGTEPAPDPDPNVGGGGGSGGSTITPSPPGQGEDSENKSTTPKKHIVSTTDQFSREGIEKFKRRAQRGNTCVPTVMEYISKLLNNREFHNRREIKKYFNENMIVRKKA